MGDVALFDKTPENCKCGSALPPHAAGRLLNLLVQEGIREGKLHYMSCGNTTPKY